MTGETQHNLRGDYSRIRPDYTVDQDWAAYTPAQHELWRRLFQRQQSLLPRHACDEFVRTMEWDPLESTCRHASLSIL